MTKTIEGRAMLYNFDFLRWRGSDGEMFICPVKFYMQGVCWKSRFSVTLKILVNGRLVASFKTDTQADAMPLVVPLTIFPGDIVVVEVIELTRRWFRRNTTHVALEGLEAA